MTSTVYKCFQLTFESSMQDRMMWHMIWKHF